MSKPNPIRIKRELEDMLLTQAENLTDPEQQAKEIYDKFIGPLVDYSEYLRQRYEAERAVPFADMVKGLPKDFTAIHH